MREFQVPRSAIVTVKPLGHGSFGKVWLATFKQQQVALKELKPPEPAGQSPRQAGGGRLPPPHPHKTFKECFLEEATNMAKLQSPKIVQLLGICAEAEPFFLITEYMPHGDLRNYLMRMGPDQVPFKLLTEMLAQVGWIFEPRIA